MVTKAQINQILSEIPDPELGISVVDLGLIYSTEVNSQTGEVRIKMTLTTIGCPLFNLISDPIKDRVKKIKGVKKVDIDLTFDPPWTPERMSKSAKAQLGII